MVFVLVRLLAVPQAFPCQEHLGYVSSARKLPWAVAFPHWQNFCILHWPICEESIHLCWWPAHLATQQSLWVARKALIVVLGDLSETYAALWAKAKKIPCCAWTRCCSHLSCVKSEIKLLKPTDRECYHHPCFSSHVWPLHPQNISRTTASAWKVQPLWLHHLLCKSVFIKDWVVSLTLALFWGARWIFVGLRQVWYENAKTFSAQSFTFPLLPSTFFRIFQRFSHHNQPVLPPAVPAQPSRGEWATTLVFPLLPSFRVKPHISRTLFNHTPICKERLNFFFSFFLVNHKFSSKRCFCHWQGLESDDL